MRLMVRFKMTPFLWASILVVQTALANDCKTSGIGEKKDGYIVFDQTKLSQEGTKRLINHAISVTTAIASTYKVTKSAATGCKAPSYYLYNGANIVDGVANITDLIKHNKESQQILEAFVGKESDIGKQVNAFDKAYEQQMVAYRAAQSRERILKATGTVRKSAVVSAGVEAITMMLGGGLAFICSPNPDAVQAVRTATQAARAAAEEGATQAAKNAAQVARDAASSARGEIKWHHLAMGQNISGVVAHAILKAIAKEKVGEVTPLSRVIYYGVQEILSTTMSKDMNETSKCMKQRADEFKNMATLLKQRLGKTDASDPKPTPNPTKVVKLTDPSVSTQEFNSGDFSGCMVNGHSGLVHDPKCSCRKNHSCYQIPQFVAPPSRNNPTQRGGGESGFPPSIASSNNQGRDFLNGVFDGNSSQENLGAGRLGQGGARLDRQRKAIEKKINDHLKKQGKRPIHFESKRRRIADNIRRAVGNTLNQAGIKSIGQFNKAIGDALIKDSPLSSPVEKAPAIVAGKARGLNLKGNSQNSFDFLEEAGEDKSGDMTSYHIPGKDIQSSGQDIFQILTYRYMKSAYPSLLKKK